MEITIKDNPKTTSIESVVTKSEKEGFNELLELHKKEVGALVNKGAKVLGFSFNRHETLWLFVTLLEM